MFAKQKKIGERERQRNLPAELRLLLPRSEARAAVKNEFQEESSESQKHSQKSNDEIRAEEKEKWWGIEVHKWKKF